MWDPITTAKQYLLAKTSSMSPGACTRLVFPWRWHAAAIMLLSAMPYNNAFFSCWCSAACYCLSSCQLLVVDTQNTAVFQAVVWYPAPRESMPHASPFCCIHLEVVHWRHMQTQSSEPTSQPASLLHACLIKLLQALQCLQCCLPVPCIIGPVIYQYETSESLL